MTGEASEPQKRVLELRKDYLKQANNPYRHMTGEGGAVVSLHKFPSI